MSEKENLTNENTFIVCKRVETKELKNKQGETYYALSVLFEYKTRAALINFYFRDNDLYSELLSIPQLNDFKLYYEVGIDYNNNLVVIPTACSL